MRMRSLLPNCLIAIFKRHMCNVTRFENEARVGKWEAIIGLEVHAQISANSKLFSGAETVFGAPVNSAVSFFDASLPGTLPVLNKACIEAAIKTSLSLNCTINKISYFDRKHYFYADLPAGFQITQRRLPIAAGGYLPYLVIDPRSKKYVEKVAHLTQIQLEQDSGKSLHDVFDKKSLIDLNRAGIGLMEIITEPDFRSADEATAFVKELQLLLQTIGACDAKMEEGSLRVDVSISIRKPHEPLGVRTEVKNLNSIRSLDRAVECEIERQIQLMEDGIHVKNETMFYDTNLDRTVVLRDKESLHDYRFMPEPNLPPLCIQDDIEIIRVHLPLLPRKKRMTLTCEDGLSLGQSVILVANPLLLDLYHKLKNHASNKALNSSVANFCINEILASVNKLNLPLEKSFLKSEGVMEVVSMLFIEKKINLSIARQILEVLASEESSTKSPRQIVTERNLEQLSDDEVLRDICLKVFQQHPDSVASYKAGKKKVLNFLIGQVQKQVGKRADGQKVVKIVNDLISK